MKNYLKLIGLCGLLSIGFLATAQTEQSIEENNMLFDIKAYEELRKKHPNTYSIEVDLGADKKIFLSNDNNEYRETIKKYNGYYMYSRVYFRPSGRLMAEQTRFYSISIGTKKIYDESGKLTLSVYYTPDDWADRLVASVKKNLNLDLSKVGYFKVRIIQNPDKTKKAVMITHLNGKYLKLDTYDPVRYFMLLDFDTFKLITDGGEIQTKISENVRIENPKSTVFPRTESTYFINGKPDSEFKW